MTITFRDTIRKLSPPWLRTGNAERFLYALALQVDAFGDALVAGVKLRFPGLYSDESLALIGRERRIRRGRTETAAGYAARLTRWLTDHRRRGGPYAMLSQLYAHFAPNNFPIELIYYSGRRYSMDEDGVVTRSDVTFSPDTDSARWARWWLFYYTDAPDLTEDEVHDLQLVPREWNAAHAQGTLVVFPSDGELWNFPLGRVWNRPRLWNVGTAPEYFPVE